MSALSVRMEVFLPADESMIGKADSQIGSVDMKIRVELPFMPTIGMCLAVVDGDDYRKVIDSYWSKADGFELYFEAEQQWTVEELKAIGWEVDEDE